MRRRSAPRARRVAGLLTLAGLVIACAPPGRPANGPPTTAISPTATSVSPTVTAAPLWTLAVAGDIHFAGRTLPLLDDPATAIGPISALLRGADLAIANLETAVTEGGAPEPKEFHFRAPPTALDALRAGGVDAAIMANNHALDYGATGLAETLAAATARGYPVVGIGADETAAYAPWVTTLRGVRVAVLALSQIHELAGRWTAAVDRPGLASALDVPRSVAAVRAARRVADVVVVYVHWGREGQPCPTGRQRALAHALADAGADAIVSTHAHLLLGDGWTGRTYVSYGLGNFVWWRDDAYSNDTGVLTLTFRGATLRTAVLTPARIGATGQPLVATGPDRTRIEAVYAARQACTGLSAAPD